jgi:hypothetical protein
MLDEVALGSQSVANWLPSKWLWGGSDIAWGGVALRRSLDPKRVRRGTNCPQPGQKE